MIGHFQDVVCVRRETKAVTTLLNCRRVLAVQKRGKRAVVINPAFTVKMREIIRLASILRYLHHHLESPVTRVWQRIKHVICFSHSARIVLMHQHNVFIICLVDMRCGLHRMTAKCHHYLHVIPTANSIWNSVILFLVGRQKWPPGLGLAKLQTCQMSWKSCLQRVNTNSSVLWAVLIDFPR